MELLDGKMGMGFKFQFRWDWEWDGNGNEVIDMGGIWSEKSVSAHIYHKLQATLFDKQLAEIFCFKFHVSLSHK